MKVATAIMISSVGFVGLMSLNERDNEIAKGPRMVRPVALCEEQIRIQQSRVRLDALRGALLQQKARLRAKTATDGVVLPA